MTAQIAALPSRRPVKCEIQAADGHTVKLLCLNPFPIRTLVKVENTAGLWMGEVWACQAQDSGYSIEIEIIQVLHDPASVERMAGRFRQAPKAEHLA